MKHEKPDNELTRDGYVYIGHTSISQGTIAAYYFNEYFSDREMNIYRSFAKSIFETSDTIARSVNAMVHSGINFTVIFNHEGANETETEIDVAFGEHYALASFQWIKDSKLGVYVRLRNL